MECYPDFSPKTSNRWLNLVDADTDVANAIIEFQDIFCHLFCKHLEQSNGVQHMFFNDVVHISVINRLMDGVNFSCRVKTKRDRHGKVCACYGFFIMQAMMSKKFKVI